MANFTRLYISVVSIVLMICGSVTLSMADEGPWKWQLSLNIKKEKLGNQILFPTGLYIDKERERYYVVDAGSNGLHSFDLQGNHLNTLKPGDQLKQPYGMVRDAKEVLWVVEKGRNTLTQIDLKEKKIVTHLLKVGDRDIYPDRMVLSGGNFFILDKLTGRIDKFDKDLQAIQEFCCSEGLGGFGDFTVSNGEIWTLDIVQKMVYLFKASGELQKKFDISGVVSFPYALEIGPAGQIYVLDRHEGSVAVFDNNGEYKYKFLSKGQSRGRLYYPEDLQFDFLGRLCVVDSGNGRVEIFGR